MIALFQPSYTRLVTSPLPLKPQDAALCVQRLAQLVSSQPDELSDSDYVAIKAAFVSGYSAFAAGTDDYSALDLDKLQQICEKAFVYSKDMIVAMLKQIQQPLYTNKVGELAGGAALYGAGFSEDGEAMVSLDQFTKVTLSSTLAMAN